MAVMDTIVDVLNEIGGGRTADLVAKIVGESQNSFTIRYLSPTKSLHGDKAIYKYEEKTYEVDKECISGYYDSTNEEDAGFIKVDGGWIQSDNDSDYTPSEEPETESDDESVVVSEED